MQESSPNDSGEKRSLSADEFHSIDDLIKSRSAMDKLKTIRPFSECDLLNLHENSYLQENGDFIDKFIEVKRAHNERTHNVIARLNCDSTNPDSPPDRRTLYM